MGWVRRAGLEANILPTVGQAPGAEETRELGTGTGWGQPGPCRGDVYLSEEEQGSGSSGLSTGNRLESQWVVVTAEVRDMDWRQAWGQEAGMGTGGGTALVLDVLEQRPETQIPPGDKLVPC